MFVVIEGLDRTGKTTLAKQLVTEADAEYHHHGPPKVHPLVEYEVDYQDFTPGSDAVVLDRGHLGEQVWPSIFGRESAQDDAAFIHIDMFLRSRGALIVYATRDHDSIKAQLDDEPINPEDVDRAGELFLAALDRSALPQTWHDFERRETDVRQLARKARYWTSLVEPLHWITPWWIGNPKPSALLVGEQANDEIGIPFVPFPSTSGNFMLNRLPQWKGLAITNALRPDGSDEHLRELWYVMEMPPVVALGKTADAALTRERIPHGAVEHPQYVRRFLRRRGDLYLYDRICAEVGKEALKA